MADRKNFFGSRSKDSGFPSLDWEDDALDTRPLPLHELPSHVRIENELSVIAARHQRIADSIRIFWGHHDCIEYMQNLIMSGYKEGVVRMGFKPEIISALMNLIALHPARK